MTSPGPGKQTAAEQEAGRQRIAGIKHRILVLSGKGGVGKSSVAANLVLALAAQGRRVGLLDVDVHGPSIPRILGVDGFPAELAGPDRASALLQTIPVTDRLRVMSLGFLLENRDTAVIWRGPMKYSVIKQFIEDVDWGELDYLVVDSPPGTGDEPLSVAQLLGTPAHAVVVTTPQELSLADVRRCVTFCRKVQVSLLGLVENMSGFVCPHCGGKTDIFKSGGGRKLAAEMNVPFLGSIPLDPRLVEAADAGTAYLERFPDTETARAFQHIVKAVVTAAEPE
ncbi:MAG: Mrp/NBP35 family ATP-binding protein [Lentisphaerae bacterium]|nr:Mrp/NBP35 family ATP-binding protein [Lentisphaerota bacterium]